MLNGILTHDIFWPQTGFSFIQQLSQHAMVGEQRGLFASDPFESKMGEGGHLGIWGVGHQTLELVGSVCER